MTAPSRANLIIGLVFLALSLVAIFIWIPLDTASGIIEKVRGRQTIGDALAPSLAAGFLLAGALLLVLTESRAPKQPSLSSRQIAFISKLVAVIVLGVMVMRFAGPVAAEITNVFRDEPMAYRVLRITPGWRHIGFVLGGMIVVTGIITLVERRLTLRGFLTAILAVMVIIAIFDLPFEDLLLPPNGDV